MEDQYARYYRTQAGGGSRPEHAVGVVYERASAQSGKGCCGIGRVLTAAATPIIMKSARAVGEELSSAGLGMYRDWQRNPSSSAMTGAAMSRLAQAGENLKRRARRALTGRGGSKKKKLKKTSKRKCASKKKKRVTTAKKKIKRRAKSSRSQKGRGALRERTDEGVYSSDSIPFDVFS